MQSGKSIPLALLSSDRWHRKLIPGLSCVSPSTAPSRVSKGPPWQIQRAMWPSQHPQRGSQSRHVAFTFCAGGPAGPSLAITRLKAETFAHFGRESLKTVCTYKTHRQSSSMLVNLHITCVFQHTFRLLASSAEQKNPECDSYLEVQTDRRQNALAFGAPEFRLFWGYSPTESCSFCMLAAPNSNLSTAAPCLSVQL